jgi:beta-galactosidase
LAALKEFQPDKPLLVGEYWSGRSMHWGETFKYREIEPVAEGYRKALEGGGLLNFYMFCGGSNFGFMNGANYGHSFLPREGDVEKYIPGLTSYDVDALISENGVPTKKYYACRRILDKYLGKPVREDNPPDYTAQTIGNVILDERADLNDNLANAAECVVYSSCLKSMEDLGQDYGYILYSTFVDGPGICGEQKLYIDGLHDRATVFTDGKYIGSYMRDRESDQIKITVPDNGVKIDILVENLGRINFGRFLKDRKGILDGVRLDGVHLFNWTISTLPMRDLSRLVYMNISDVENLEDKPAFYRGMFEAKTGIDTFLHMKDWTKGCVWINGFNIGRYWEMGPQETLYVPGELLKDKDNVIEIFELHKPKNNLIVNFIDHSILDGEVIQ